MKKLVFLIPLIAFTMGITYAEPLENIQTSVLNSVDNTATVKITWNGDDQVSSYKIGCVSCFPNIVENTTENNIVIRNVTSFPNSPLAILYALAFDSENEILSAKQIFIDLTQ